MNSQIKLGSLKEVDIRNVWKDEAKDFTPWLLNNVEELSASLGLDLELHQAEHPVGRFSLDLIGVIGGTQDRVIIENQLGASDHTHFGQLLTYAGGTDAKYVIWIASKFRDEYISAIKWLNDGTTEEINFFAVEVSAVQIGDSLPAPLFKVVAQPNEWSKEAKANASAAISGERGQLQVEFWAKYLTKVAESRPTWTSSRRGRPQNWLALTARFQGASFCVAFTGTQMKSELIFDSKDSELNRQRFDYLLENQSVIEKEYGAPLIWHAPEGNIQCILRSVEPGDFMKEESWEKAIEWMLDSQTRLRAAVEPYLQQLKQIT